MIHPRLLRIGNRINLLLVRELGQGIDVQRLIADPLYARDVLLVCDAMPGSDLASLAQHFRVARSEPPGANGGDSTGFGTTTRPATLDQPGLRTAPRPWYSPARWLGL